MFYIPDYKYAFDIERGVDSLGTPYDFESMMHYGAYAFSKNRRETITTIDRSKQRLIGQRNGFSKIDIQQINLLYSCPGGGGPLPTDDPGPLPPTDGPGTGGKFTIFLRCGHVLANLIE